MSSKPDCATKRAKNLWVCEARSIDGKPTVSASIYAINFSKVGALGERDALMVEWPRLRFRIVKYIRGAP